MINSCGTGKPTEADGERGSGRKRRQLFGCSAVRAVRAVRLFGCSAVRAVRLFGCSAVRAVRLIGRRRLSSPAWPAASVAKPPPQQEPAAAAATADSSSLFLCCCFFAAVAYRQQRRGQNPPMCWLCWWLCWSVISGEGSPPPHGQRRA